MTKADAPGMDAGETLGNPEAPDDPQQAAHAGVPVPERSLLEQALSDIALSDKVLLGKALFERTPVREADQQDTLFADQAPHVEMVDHLTRLQREYQQLRAMLDKMSAQLSHREAHVRQRLRDVLAMADPVEPDPDQDPARPSSRAAATPTLYVRALGQFAVSYRDQEIALGSSKNGRAIFRYLVTRPDRRVAKDVLLELFWPGDAPQTANHKLHIAISSLRKALDEALGETEDGGSLLFVDDHYLLSPDLHVELDVDAYEWRVRAGERLDGEGRMGEAIAEYEAARALYRGEYMSQDLYADWTVPQRARYEEMYLTLLGRLAHHYSDRHRYEDSIACCRQILARDSFREDAYRQLMRCYSRLGRRNQALCEYETCKEVMRWELGVDPMHETTALYDRIVREEPV
ncbi:MAG: winged helix-turn-helix domain-containing protein [Anaerolineae bacterium]|nr:winged helix-turn-helix domain-containing protein [Anaerolineae bacterium]